jgi:hypothetical protein
LQNKPYHYITRDIRAIIAYILHLPTSVSQLEADLQQLSAAHNHTPLSTKCEAHLVFQKNQAECCEQLATVQTQRTQQEHWTLEERLACSFLAKQIGEQMYTPIAPKSIVFNFTKTTTANLIGIFKLKITATALHLKSIVKLEEHWFSTTPDQRHTFKSFVDKIQSFGFDLEICTPAITCIQWQSLN